jgi:hypothetical protein
MKPLGRRKVFAQLLRQTFRKKWVVYSKRPFGGAEHVWVAKNTKRQTVQPAKVRFTPPRSSYSDDEGLRAESVRVCWSLAMTVGPVVAHSVHPY